MQHADLRERVLEANLALGRAGLVVLTFGNASAVDRAAGVVAIKPSGLPYERLSPADITLVDLATATVLDGETRPSSDTPTHLALYRAWPDVGGIAHDCGSGSPIRHLPRAQAASRDPLLLRRRPTPTTSTGQCR